MGKKTYGQLHETAGTVQATGGSVSDPIGAPGISLWGHSIVLDEETGIKCKLCDKEEDVPDLLSTSSGFREVVYKMYILGQFREDSCSPDLEAIEEMMKDRGRTNRPDKARHQVDPNKIHWSGKPGVKTKTTNGHNSDLRWH